MKNDSNVKKIIIVGAGISGLSAGIYAQKNGFSTKIYEKNPTHGGLCTAWKREGMNIDGCIHWLTGTKEGTDINLYWHDLNAFKKEDIIYSDNFGTIEAYGTPVILWCDLQKLEDELIEISPEDKRLVKKVIKYIYKFQNMPLPVDVPKSTMNLWKLLKVGCSMIPYLIPYTVAKKIQTKKFAQKFKSPVLKYAFERIVPGEGNLYTTLYAFGTIAVGNGGIPKGGSLTLVNNLAEEYKRVGGEIFYNKEVSEIVIDHGFAKGVKFKDNSLDEADIVITALDSLEVIYTLLNHKFKISGFEKRRLNHKDYPTQSCVLATYKVDLNTLKDLNLTYNFEFPCKRIRIGKTEFNSIKIHDYSYDQTFINDKYTVINVLLPQSDADYDYWNNLNKKDKKEYLNKKLEIAEEIKERIIYRFPSLKNKIKCIDICTPSTFKKFTNAYHGAYMPFAYTSKGSMFYHNGKVNHLNNLYFAGQWEIFPGGLPIAMLAGKFAIQRILKDEHRWYKFKKLSKFIYRK